MNWMMKRLREPSTWRGLVWLATVAGLSFRPDQAESIVTAGMALAGLLGVFLADEPQSDPRTSMEVQAEPESAQPQPVQPVNRVHTTVQTQTSRGFKSTIQRRTLDDSNHYYWKSWL